MSDFYVLSANRKNIPKRVHSCYVVWSWHFWDSCLFTRKQQHNDRQTLAAFSALQPKHKVHPIRCSTLYWWVLPTNTLTFITAPVKRLTFTMTNSSQLSPTKTWNKDLREPHIHQQPLSNLHILYKVNNILQAKIHFSNVTNLQTG